VQRNPDEKATMRIAFLVGSEGESTIDTLEAVCALSTVSPVGILFDDAHPGPRARARNLRRNIAREGVLYAFRRLLAAVVSRLEQHASASVVDPSETDALLRKAFPNRSWTVEEFAHRNGIPFHRVGNLNHAPAAETLRRLDADLGIVLGTRILKSSIFSVPHAGSINLHKGKVPEYRGLPPGFWELYNNEVSASATVHFVDAGLDTGDVVADDSIVISPRETPDTLRVKLNWLGTKVLCEAVTAIASGQCVRRPQQRGTTLPYTKPTSAQNTLLAQRLPHWRRLGLGSTTAKLCLYLLLYHSGLWSLRRRWRSPSRAAVLLYHRVNDWAVDPLTTSVRRFAEHILTLQKHYPIITTHELLHGLNTDTIPANASVIHFDDCYQDIYTNALPILRAAGVGATAFISTGFIDTDRIFDHDHKYPHRYPNLTSLQCCEWAQAGCEVGAHTVNHVDLGQIAIGDARAEVVASGTFLTHMLQQRVRYFSYPFGGKQHIRPEVVEEVQAANYDALFSAYGGFVRRGCSRYDIPRIGLADQSPIILLMTLEALSLGQIRASISAQWNRVFSRTKPSPDA
jgi:peptidoglycan/xylan/chitin deacetylase (PgdA/CDA1 family)/folate-dependent phosphoribosylglycinamide formyltransferase PurN